MEDYLRDAILGFHVDHEVCLCMGEWTTGETAVSFVSRNLSCGWRQDIDLSDPLIADIPKDDADLADHEAYVKRRHLLVDQGGAQTLCSAGAYMDRSTQQSVSSTKHTPDRSTSTPRRKELVPFFSKPKSVNSVSSSTGTPGSGRIPSRISSKTTGKASKSPKTPKQKVSGGSVSRSSITNNSHSGGSVPSSVMSRADEASQASTVTPRSYCTGSPQGLSEAMFDSLVDVALSKFSLYRLEKPDSEFIQSYDAPPAEAFDLGSMVPPSRKDISMCQALAELGDTAGLLSFERSLYQIAVLRSRAMSIAWATFIRRINELVRKSIAHSAKIMLEMLKFNGISGPLLQLIIADVGVVNNDKTKVLDSLINIIEEDKKQHIVIKVKLGNSIQATLEYIYVQLKTKITNSRSQSSDQFNLDTAVRRAIFQNISELYKWRFRNRQIVIVVERISHNLCEFLYILQLLKNDEGLVLSCILCANCWQTNLDQHVSLRVYHNLCIVNCDVLSVNRVSDEILRVVLFESETQCFLPHLIQLEVMWNTLYDEEMSINALIRRIYRLYEHFYRSSQLSFACLPGVFDVKATVREKDDSPGFEIELDENIGDILHTRLGLLFCGVDFSDSHVAFLQLLLDQDATPETICLHKLPQETIQLIERRLSMQLAMLILYELMTYLPDCNRLRDRLSLLATTFHSEHTERRVYDMIKRLTRLIASKSESALSSVISTMKDMGPHFLTVYPTVRALARYLGRPPKHDLIKEYTEASTDGTRAGIVAAFVDHSLTYLLVPGMHTGSRLAHHIMLCRFQHHVYDWNNLCELLTTRECTGFARDLKYMIKLSQAILCRNINVWELFCLFSSQLHEVSVSSAFFRFSMALDTLIHILGYYACTNLRSAITLDFSDETHYTLDMRLIKAIKTKLSRFKVRRIHLGKYL